MGSPDRLLFQLPVYRKAEDSFYVEQQRLLAPYLDAVGTTYQTEIEADTWGRRIIGATTWQFNDVVGWVTVHGYYDMVKTYLWWTTAKVLRRRGHHIFEPLGKLSETLIFDEMSNAEISDAVRTDMLAAVAEGRPTKSRHLDLRPYDAVSPHLDWRAVLRACEQRASSP